MKFNMVEWLEVKARGLILYLRFTRIWVNGLASPYMSMVEIPVASEKLSSTNFLGVKK